MKKLVIMAISLLFTLLSYARLNDVFLLKGRVRSFDKQVVQVSSFDNYVQWQVPRKAVVTEFKLITGAQAQTIPIQTKYFSTIKASVENPSLGWPKDAKKISAATAIKQLQNHLKDIQKNTKSF